MPRLDLFKTSIPINSILFKLFTEATARWKIATILDAEIIIPDYHLIPYSNHKEAYSSSLALYKNITKNVSSENIIIIGDSAGGGLSLGLTLLLKEKQLPLPQEVILLSPWLDITMSNPEISADLNRKDVMCNLDTLIYLGKLWADNEEHNNYLLSPINGDLTDLPCITIFVGTRELFLPDAKLLHNRLVEAGNHGKLHIYNEMIHVFQVLPIPEAEKSIREIIRIISSS
ncbi:MAG: alpha/beta hydrolase [Spirochaetales bacterium]|nr:alpha/beta hydrolase [Spirochaetales bacterium]